MDKKYPMLTDFRQIEDPSVRWLIMLDALENEYTTSFSTACETLMSSRAWVTKYIKSQCHYIFISNHYKKIAGLISREYKDNIYFNTEEFDALIKTNIISCTRQTISVPVEMLLKPDCTEYFRERFVKLNDELKNACEKGDISRIRSAKKEVAALEKECFNPLFKGCDAGKLVTARSKAVPVDIAIPEFDLSELMAVHDLKGYGSTDELIYRDLFRRGCIRIVVKIPDSDGCMSEKIYYLNPGNDFSDRAMKNSVCLKLFTYEDYIAYKERLALWNG